MCTSLTLLLGHDNSTFIFAISLFWAIAISIDCPSTQLAIVSRKILSMTSSVVFVCRLVVISVGS